MLRDLREGPTELGQFLRENWKVDAIEGIAMDLITSAIEQSFPPPAHSGVEQDGERKRCRGFILDGAPRTGDGAWQLSEELAKRGVSIDAIIEFRITEEVAKHRLLGRRIDAGTGNIYHVDDEVGTASKLTLRHDDTTEEDVATRIKSFRNHFKRVKNFFQTTKTPQGESWPLFEVDAREPKEEVLRRVLEIINGLPGREQDQAAAVTRPSHVRSTSKVSGMEGAIIKQRMKKITGTHLGAGVFPGSHPVSLSQANLDTLVEHRDDYVVGYKWDGTRQLLFISHGKVYLLDRKMAVRRLLIRSSGGDNGTAGTADWSEWNGTLLDGELITAERRRGVVGAAGQEEGERKPKRIRFDSEQDNGEEGIGGYKETKREKHGEAEGTLSIKNGATTTTILQSEFIVLDVLSVKGANLMRQPYPERIDAAVPFLEFVRSRQADLEHLVFCLSDSAKQEQEEDRVCFTLHRYHPVADVASLIGMGTTATHVSAQTDGLVFQPRHAPYCIGYSDDILKWKPPNQTTIDFYISRSADDLAGTSTMTSSSWWQLYVMAKNNRMKLWDRLALRSDEEARAGIADGSIVECFWDAEGGAWKLYRVRRDKDKPNAEWVANQIWAGIESGLVGAENLVVALLQNSSSSAAAASAEERRKRAWSDWHNHQRGLRQQRRGLGKRKRAGK